MGKPYFTISLSLTRYIDPAQWVRNCYFVLYFAFVSRYCYFSMSLSVILYIHPEQSLRRHYFITSVCYPLH